MSTTFHSAGRITASQAQAIRRNAICVLGSWHNVQSVIDSAGRGIELVSLPEGDYQLRIAANDDHGPYTPAPAMRGVA